MTVDVPRLWTYRSFAKTRNSDTRVEVLLLPQGKVTVSGRSTLQKWGFGLYRLGKDQELEEILKALDQTLQPDLPPLLEFPARHRAKLGKAYDHFKDAEWIPGFEAACVVLEQLARKHLLVGIQSTRISFAKKTGPPFTLTKQQVGKLPIGPLAQHFDMILSKTVADSEIGNALKAVNPARIEAAHRKGTAKADKFVRHNVESNMWSILTAMRHFK